jgi:hypothetical protein
MFLADRLEGDQLQASAARAERSQPLKTSLSPTVERAVGNAPGARIESDRVSCSNFSIQFEKLDLQLDVVVMVLMLLVPGSLCWWLHSGVLRYGSFVVDAFAHCRL